MWWLRVKERQITRMQRCGRSAGLSLSLSMYVSQHPPPLPALTPHTSLLHSCNRLQLPR